MNDNEATIKIPVQEEAVTETKSDGKFDGLSNRDALSKAIEERRGLEETRESKEERPTQKVEPTKTEVKAAVEADSEPPSEFSQQGKEAWKNKDIGAIQKEFRRIHDGRTQEIHRAQTSEKQAKEDAKTWRDLGAMAAPYIEARGAEGVTPQKAMMEALALIQEFKKGDPASVKAELKRIGIDLDKAPTSTEKTSDTQIEPLQKRIERLESEREEQKLQQTVQSFDTVFKVLTSQKTRTGECVFPDLLDNSEKGIQLARELGSLTQDQRFQAGVLRRFPDADLIVLVREAYKYLGGRVSGESVTVSQDNQKQIEKQRRAAASSPGRAPVRNESSSLVGKLGRRAALAKALEDHREH